VFSTTPSCSRTAHHEPNTRFVTTLSTGVIRLVVCARCSAIICLSPNRHRGPKAAISKANVLRKRPGRCAHQSVMNNRYVRPAIKAILLIESTGIRSSARLRWPRGRRPALPRFGKQFSSLTMASSTTIRRDRRAHQRQIGLWRSVYHIIRAVPLSDNGPVTRLDRPRGSPRRLNLTSMTRMTVADHLYAACRNAGSKKCGYDPQHRECRAVRE